MSIESTIVAPIFELEMGWVSGDVVGWGSGDGDGEVEIGWGRGYGTYKRDGRRRWQKEE